LTSGSSAPERDVIGSGEPVKSERGQAVLVEGSTWNRCEVIRHSTGELVATTLCWVQGMERIALPYEGKLVVFAVVQYVNRGEYKPQVRVEPVAPR